MKTSPHRGEPPSGELYWRTENLAAKPRHSNSLHKGSAGETAVAYIVLMRI
jgi:hypothetical protein